MKASWAFAMRSAKCKCELKGWQNLSRMNRSLIPLPYPVSCWTSSTTPRQKMTCISCPGANFTPVTGHNWLSALQLEINKASKNRFLFASSFRWCFLTVRSSQRVAGYSESISTVTCRRVAVGGKLLGGCSVFLWCNRHWSFDQNVWMHWVVGAGTFCQGHDCDSDLVVCVSFERQGLKTDHKMAKRSDSLGHQNSNSFTFLLLTAERVIVWGNCLKKAEKTRGNFSGKCWDCLSVSEWLHFLLQVRYYSYIGDDLQFRQLPNFAWHHEGIAQTCWKNVSFSMTKTV